MESLFFLIHIFFSLNTNSYCQCKPISVAQNFKTSSIIFIGEVLSVDTMKLYEAGLPKQSYRGGHLASVKVIKLFKGTVKADTISVMTGEGYGDCGYDFKLLNKCIIYGRELNYILIDSTNLSTLEFHTSPKVYLTTTNCDRTTENTEKEGKLITEYLRGHKN